MKQPPGFPGRFTLADAVWLGGMLNGTPQQYVQFTTDGITVVSPTAIVIQAPQATVHGNLKVTGTTELEGAVTAQSTITASGEVKSGSIGLQTHHHTAQGATAPTTSAQG